MKYIRKKIYDNSKKKIITLTSSVIVICIIFLSIGFSVLSNTLGVNGISAAIRINENIRIKSMQYLDSSDEAYSLAENYNVTNINGTVVLPHENSYVDYKFSIINIGNVEEGIANIIGSNKNLTYELIGDYNIGDKICDDQAEYAQCKLGIEKSIIIRIKWANEKYNTLNTQQSFVYNFEFEQFNTVIKDSSVENLITNCPTEVINKGNLTFKYNGDIDNLIIYVGGTQKENYEYDEQTKIVSLNNVDGTVYLKKKTEKKYLGESVEYLGKNWYVLSTNSATATLIADYDEFPDMSHCTKIANSDYCYWENSSSSSQYKWSKSQIVDYLNNTWLSTVDDSDLISFEICDDEYTTGGPHLNDGTSCTNGYVTSKVRFISGSELNETKEAMGDNTSWLYGKKAYNALGASYSFEANFVNNRGELVAARSINSGGNYNADHNTPIRPVISIPMSNLKELFTKTITYENIDENNLPSRIDFGDDLVISFTGNYNDIFVYSDGILLTNGYTFENNVLTIKDVTGNLLIKAKLATIGEVGDSVTYLGKTWNILSKNENYATLIADYDEFPDMAHCIKTVSTDYCFWVSKTSNAQYKWSNSQIADYLNNTWLSTVDSSDLVEFEICDDDYTNKGSHLNDGTSCNNGYIKSKVRFITKEEFTTAKTVAGTNTEWLYGAKPYNAMGSNYQFESNFINTTGSFVAARSLDSKTGSYNADHNTPIRPVITVPTNKILGH